jgi:hypothetical protein
MKNVKRTSPRQALHVERDIEARSRNHSRRVKTITIIYSEYGFVALVIQHALRMRRIILSFVVCLALLNNYYIF